MNWKQPRNAQVDTASEAQNTGVTRNFGGMGREPKNSKM